MVNQWYYGRGGDKLGPFSANQLKKLAAAGYIVEATRFGKKASSGASWYFERGTCSTPFGVTEVGM